ncbi:hypothetical protein GO755_09175 [Spirosoma sp. HMF4905]|uniref:Uncharacterized protein n=1 Tax=Spirosoma arboris TaxID=2682092 RepID=A0A7K1S8R6_9BACT|nr:hypothetical protein [Spirosoma arboris]MVM30204.1 hypothetical protein [Spirosoma arboris]
MRYLMPSSSELTGADSSRVPTGMENDPTADEEVINQQDGEEYPKSVEEHPAEEAKIAPDNLADSIAYALDGSGPGPTNAKPNVSGHDVITEGTSGAGPEEEERIFGK